MATLNETTGSSRDRQQVIEWANLLRKSDSYDNEYRLQPCIELTADTTVYPYIRKEAFYETYYAPSSMTSSDYEAYWDRLWEHPGTLVFNQESLFPETSDGCLSPAEHFYDSCPAKELRQYVRARGIPDPFPGGLTVKYFYLKALLDADSDFRFSLMKLPAEMRLLIYKELLIFEQNTESRLVAHPNILQACRAINKEATPILYGNTVTCVLRAFEDDDGISGQCKVHNTWTDVDSPEEPLIRIPDGMDDFPEFLRRIPNLEIRLDVVSMMDQASFEVAGLWAHRLLLNLSSSFMDDHKIESLTLAIEDASFKMDIRTVLYPLLRLRNIANVKFVNDVDERGFAYFDLPKHVQRKLMARLASSAPSFNTMKQYMLLKEEAKTLLVLLHSPSLWPHKSASRLKSMHDTIVDHVQLAQKVQGLMFSSNVEENLQARLYVLQNGLNKIKAPSCTAPFRDFLRQRKARKAYSAISNQWQLEYSFEEWEDKLEDTDELYRSCPWDWFSQDDFGPDGEAKNAELSHMCFNCGCQY